jgi:hypothetical protein
MVEHITREIRKLKLERNDIARAIADFERLAAGLSSHGRAVRKRPNNLILIKLGYKPRT